MMKNRNVLIVLTIIFLLMIVIFKTSNLSYYILPSKTISSNEINLNTFHFVNHYHEIIDTVKCEIDPYKPVALKDFNAEVAADGNLLTLSYEFFYMKNGKYYQASVAYDSKGSKLTVQSKKIHRWIYNYTMVSMKDYFEVLDAIGYAEISKLLSLNSNENAIISYKGWYTFDESDGKDRVAFYYNHQELTPCSGTPPFKKTTMVLSKKDVTGIPISESFEILFDGYSTDSRNPNT